MSDPDPGNIGTVPPQYGAQYPLSRATITDIQKDLQAAGLYRGGNTSYGAWNPHTNDAIKEFQRMHYLQPTGQFDKATAKALWHLQDCLSVYVPNP
jgi:peptidoglycan hydrolase-like protein with peptidoglycan-binding domain